MNTHSLTSLNEPPRRSALARALARAIARAIPWALAIGLVLQGTAVSLAQEGPAKTDREKEIAELQAMLGKVDAALSSLEPLVHPKFRLELYDVRALTYRLNDHYAPRLSIPSANAGSKTGEVGGLAMHDDYDVAEDSSAYDPETLVDLVRSAVGEELWDEPASLEYHRGTLIVEQTALAHARIASFLKDLKTAPRRGVLLDIGFYELPAELAKSLEDAATAKGGVLEPALLKSLDESVAAGQAKLSSSAAMRAMNKQRVYLHQGLEQTYIETIGRVSGGTGMVVQTVSSPEVEVLRTGLALEMRNTIVERDGKAWGVGLDLRFVESIATAIEGRATPWGTIDVPRLASRSFRSSARVPNGAGMLVYASQLAEGSDRKFAILVRPKLCGP